MSIKALEHMIITDDDINWVEKIIGSNIKFDESRRNAIKNLDSIDVQAFPGSGKTTLLVAKLAILSQKWQSPNSGICVLSHTNVAREEIENRLGNTDIGHKMIMAFLHMMKCYYMQKKHLLNANQFLIHFNQDFQYYLLTKHKTQMLFYGDELCSCKRT